MGRETLGGRETLTQTRFLLAGLRPTGSDCIDVLRLKGFVAL